MHDPKDQINTQFGAIYHILLFCGHILFDIMTPMRYKDTFKGHLVLELRHATENQLFTYAAFSLSAHLQKLQDVNGPCSYPAYDVLIKGLLD